MKDQIVDLEKKNEELAQLIQEGLIKNNMDAETYSLGRGRDLQFAHRMTVSPLQISLMSLRQIAGDLRIEGPLLEILL